MKNSIHRIKICCSFLYIIFKKLIAVFRYYSKGTEMCGAGSWGDVIASPAPFDPCVLCSCMNGCEAAHASNRFNLMIIKCTGSLAPSANVHERAPQAWISVNRDGCHAPITPTLHITKFCKGLQNKVFVVESASLQFLRQNALPMANQILLWMGSNFKTCS